MEFGKAFTYAFDDPEWMKKLGIAGLLLIIPIIGWLAVAGWAIEITKRVIARDPQPLPAWSNFGDFLMKGLMVWVIGFVYSLPILLISGCQQGVVFGLQSQDDSTLKTAASVLSLCFSCISVVYSLLLGVVLPAAYGKYAFGGQLGSAFRFSEVIGMVRRAPSAYLLVLLGGIVASIVGSLGVILCVVGLLFTYAYASVIMAHLWGQAYNVAEGAPAQIAAV